MFFWEELQNRDVGHFSRIFFSFLLVAITEVVCQQILKCLVWALTTICNKIWQTREWLTPWTRSLVITLPKERQPASVPELPSDQPHQPLKQCHAEDHTEETETTSEDYRWRTGRIQSRKEHYRADLQPKNPLWEILPEPARPLPCLHRLQEGLRQGLACSFVGNHEEVQHQSQPHPSHQKPLWQGHFCSPLQQQHRRLVPNSSWSPIEMSALTHPLQHISGKDYDRRLRRSWRHCQH